MINFLAYVCLSATFLITGIIVIYKRRKVIPVSTLIVFYLFSSGITWVGEFTVLGVFNSYHYKTGLFTNPWAQNLIGHLLLNTTMFPATAIIMVAYSLRRRWLFVFAAIFVLVELMFDKLGFYEQHWWKYYMSAINTILFLVICQKWFIKINKNRQGKTRAAVYFFAALVIIHIPAPLLLLFGKNRYWMDFIYQITNDLYRTSIIITFTYLLLEAFLMVLVACILKNPWWKLIPLIVSPLGQLIMAKLGILIITGGWKLVYTIIIYELLTVIFFLMEKYTLKPVTDTG